MESILSDLESEEKEELRSDWVEGEGEEEVRDRGPPGELGRTRAVETLSPLRCIGCWKISEDSAVVTGILEVGRRLDEVLAWSLERKEGLDEVVVMGWLAGVEEEGEGAWFCPRGWKSVKKSEFRR